MLSRFASVLGFENGFPTYMETRALSCLLNRPFPSCLLPKQPRLQGLLLDDFHRRSVILKIVEEKALRTRLLPKCPNKSLCETIHMKMSSTYRFIFMQIKILST